MKRLLLALVFSLIACDETTFTGPSPIPRPSGPTQPLPPPPQAPRVDQAFSMDSYKGVIAFGLGNSCQDEGDVLAFVSAYMARGWNTFQVCSETEFWDEGACTTFPAKPRDPERLAWLLDTIARVPGAQVALIGNCTLKRQVPLPEQFDWAHDVACIVKGGRPAGPRTCAPGIAPRFQNVAIFTHNEFDNCRGRSDWGGSASYCAGKEDVAEHVRLYRRAGIQWVTADDSFSWPRPGDSESLTYGFRLANIGASPASFHPDREKNGQPWDPSPHMLERLADFSGLYVLSETVALMDYSGRCDGLRTCDLARVEAYIARCAAVSGGRCKFTLHSESQLAGIPATQIPEAR